MGKEISKFNTERKGNQLLLRVTKGYASEAEAVLYMADGLTWKVNNPGLFSELFGAQSLDDVWSTALSQGYTEVISDDSILTSGEWV